MRINIFEYFIKADALPSENHYQMPIKSDVPSLLSPIPSSPHEQRCVRQASRNRSISILERTLAQTATHIDTVALTDTRPVLVYAWCWRWQATLVPHTIIAPSLVRSKIILPVHPYH